MALCQLLAAAPDDPPQKIRGLVQDSVDVNWRPPAQPQLPGFGIKTGSLRSSYVQPPQSLVDEVKGAAVPDRVKITSPAGMTDFVVTSPTTAYAYEGQGVVSKVESSSDGPTQTTDIQIDLAPTVVQADERLILRQIDGQPLWQRRSDGYWNATAMCNAAGKLMANYTRNAGTQEFMDELSGSMRIRIDLLTTVQVTGPNAERGTWVHPKVAYHLAQWLSPRFAVRVSGWIEELLTTGRVDLRPEPDLKTVPGLRRELRDGALKLLAALEYQEELAINLAVAEERAVVAEDKALEQAKQAGREERAIPLSVWLNHTMNQHGHGPIIGRKMMSALGLLKVEMVRGCAHTVEAEISAKMLRNNVLLYRTQTVQKTKVLEKGKPAVPLVDRRGNPVMVTSRTVCVDADVGPDWLMTWFMTEPECALLHRGCHFVSVVSGWARWFSRKRERGASLLQ